MITIGIQGDKKHKQIDIIFAYMVGGFKHFLFSIIYGIILPIDYVFISRWLKPPTRYIWICLALFGNGI